MSKPIQPHIKVVLFDFDDTLVGTIGPKWEQHKYIAKTYYNIELTDDEIRNNWGIPYNKFVSNIYKTNDIENAIYNNTKHHDKFPVTIFDGTLPTLRSLKNQNYLTGIVTSTTKIIFEHDFNYSSITTELIDYMQSSSDTIYHKPDKRVFDPAKTWLEKNSIKPHEVLYVGDSLRDMTAAMGAGFDFIGVETGLTTSEIFKANGAKSIPSIKYLL